MNINALYLGDVTIARRVTIRVKVLCIIIVCWYLSSTINSSVLTLHDTFKTLFIADNLLQD